MYETVSSGNAEKTSALIEKIKNQELEQEKSIISSKDQDYGKERRSNADNTAENNKEAERCHDNAMITKSEDIGVSEEIEEGNITEDQHVRIQGMLNQRFESYSERILHVASRLGHCDIVKILLEAGADPTIRYGKFRSNHKQAFCALYQR